MEKVSSHLGDVPDPDNHVQMVSATLLKLEVIEVGEHIPLFGIFSVSKQVLYPPICVCSCEVASGYMCAICFLFVMEKLVGT